VNYSEEIIIDDNFDIEHEKLCDILGFSYAAECNFYDDLPDGFSRQDPDKETQFVTYVKSRFLPDKGSDFQQAIHAGEIVVKFGNGYMSKKFSILC